MLEVFYFSTAWLSDTAMVPLSIISDFDSSYHKTASQFVSVRFQFALANRSQQRLTFMLTFSVFFAWQSFNLICELCLQTVISGGVPEPMQWLLLQKNVDFCSCPCIQRFSGFFWWYYVIEHYPGIATEFVEADYTQPCYLPVTY